MLIQRLYSEIRNTKKVPLNLSVSNKGSMNKVQFDYELQKGMNDVKNGKTCTLDEVKKS